MINRLGGTSPDGQDNWVFSTSNTLGSANFGNLVFDPESPSLNISERPTQRPEPPSPSANSSVEITSGNSAKSKSNNVLY